MINNIPQLRSGAERHPWHSHAKRGNERLFPLLLVIALLSPPALAAYPPLQPLINQAKPGQTLIPPPGTYAGPVVIDFDLVLDGQNQVTIDGGGKGTVVLLDTDGAQLRNLRLTNSGNSHNDIDSCVQVRGNFNIIKDNTLDNCLFGMDLQQSNNNIARRNRIQSKNAELGLRGDAIRLWYSNNNQIIYNTIEDSRDTVVWYSKDNLIAHNSATRGRYALHFMYSQANRVESNRYWGNSVGIFLMYSDDVVVRHNHISHTNGPAGMGIGLKETSGLTVEDNEIIYCAAGIYVDLSPYQPDSENHFRRNLIAYNGSGMLFHNDWTGNIVENNNFKGNITEIAVQGARTAARNRWQGNYWDSYEGFDRDHDGVGDTPYEIYSYADRLLADAPYAGFFNGSPLLEVLNFLEQLAPFTEPRLVLRDSRPLAAPVALEPAPKEAALTPFGR
jgi:nitrous oxidase accessory protein